MKKLLANIMKTAPETRHYGSRHHQGSSFRFHLLPDLSVFQYRYRGTVLFGDHGGDFTRFSLDVDEKTWTLLQYDFVDMNQSVQPELIAAIEKEGVILYEKV